MENSEATRVSDGAQNCDLNIGFVSLSNVIRRFRWGDLLAEAVWVDICELITKNKMDD